MWEKEDGECIALELESAAPSITRKEIPQLLRTEARLRVCITYVRDQEVDWRPLRIGKEVQGFLRSRPSSPLNSLLVLVGTSSLSSWKGFCYGADGTMRVLPVH